MSQTPSQMRKVPVHILDDLSSKFLINLVSFVQFVFLSLLLTCFLFVWSLFLVNNLLTHSLMGNSLISFDCSFKLN